VVGAKMEMVMERLRDPQSWPASVWVLLLTGAVTTFFQVFYRPSLHKKAPSWWKSNDWPIVGAVKFYTARNDYFREAMAHSATGDFSFMVGKKHIVGMSSPEGRKTFFDSRQLNFTEGFAELLTGQPATPPSGADFPVFFGKTLLAMLKKDNFVKNLDLLTGDTRRACEELASAPPAKVDPTWRVTNPFDSLYDIVYKLTMRTVGANDIAEDPALTRLTLSQFESFERRESTTKVVFPWLPTPNHIMRLYSGARLAMVFQKIINERKKTGKKGTDALQYMIDQGIGIELIIAFQIGALFAGQLNSGINAAWFHVHLSQSPEWMARVREEVDAAVAKHRTSPDQSPAEVLGTLTIDEWESEFPLIDLCLRDTIRLNSPGTGFRKNTSGQDIPIGSTGEVIPNGSFAAYLIDATHLNPDIYTDPMKFDPGRYLDGRNEDKKVPHGYLGWGAGRHPCLGMKFAKLEMAIIAAYFVAMFDFELSDADGNFNPTPPAGVNRNQKTAAKPAVPVYLRYKPRVFN
jgi:cytochrome P450